MASSLPLPFSNSVPKSPYLQNEVQSNAPVRSTGRKRTCHLRDLQIAHDNPSPERQLRTASSIFEDSLLR